MDDILEKASVLVDALNKRAKSNIFKLEQRSDSWFFVLEIPNIGTLIDIPISEINANDYSNPV